MFSVGVVRRGFTSACLAAAAAISLGSTAIAQERPFSWTGFYIGAHGGYNSTDIDFPFAKPYVAPPAPCNGCGPPRQELSGAIIGGQVGANYQMGMIVLGIEADLSKAKLNGSVRDGNYIVQTDTVDLMGSLRGRVGVAFGRFMPYLTAGMLWERGTRGQSCPADPAAVVAGHCSAGARGGPFGPYDLKSSQWHDGFVWGGGVEYALANHITIKLEGLRSDLGKETYVLSPGAMGQVVNTSVISHETTSLRFGMNYKF